MNYYEFCPGIEWDVAVGNLHTLKNHFQEHQMFANRMMTSAIVIGLLFLVLLSRLVYLQVFNHELYHTLSFNNQVRLMPITPNRGLILDRNNIIVAENKPAFSLEITRSQVDNLEETIEALKKILPISDYEVQQFYKQLKYKRKDEGIPIRMKLTEEEVAKFALEQHRFEGVEINARLIRHYPFGEVFAHLLGYIGPISEKEVDEIDSSNYRGTYHIGKVGIEKYYEEELHGITGYQHIETDARGRMIRILQRIPPKPGKTLHLALDARFQQAAFEALKDLQGAIVAINPKNGNVLALVSQPSFDPNLFTQGIDVINYHSLQTREDRPLYNRATLGQYPPGSTVKPMVAIEALESDIVTPSFRIFDPGFYQINGTGRLYRDWVYHKKHQGHGWVDLEKAIQESCDTYFFSIAQKIGIRKMQDVFTRFGMGLQTKLDISHEAAGLIPSEAWKKKVRNENWYAGDTLNTVIGQGMMLATPMQMAQATAILANRGMRFKPRLVVGTSTEPSQIEEILPVEEPIVLLNSDSHWDLVITAMQKVVHAQGGTAHKISQGINYTVAGKTGTAQVFNLKQNEKYNVNQLKSHLRDHSWFIAFSPVENPEIALAVIVENKYQTSGADVARKVFDAYYKNREMNELTKAMNIKEMDKLEMDKLEMDAMNRMDRQEE